MKKRVKRCTFFLPAELEKTLLQLKQGEYKNASWDELFCDLLTKGLTQAEQEHGKPEQADNHPAVASSSK